jgi:FtsP/CotA-like multicopper oxidase with cupredoxin domain
VTKKRNQFTRRDMFKFGAAAGAAGIVGKAYGAYPGLCPTDPPITPISDVAFTGCGVGGEALATSPWICEPFTDPLPVPTAMKPGYRNPDGTFGTPGAADEWSVREKNNDQAAGISRPGFGAGYQDSFGERPVPNDGTTFNFVDQNGGIHTKTLDFGGARAGTHQLYPGGLGTSYANLSGLAKSAFDLLNATPILYHIRLQVAQHAFTTSDVQPIAADGTSIPLPAGVTALPSKTGRRGHYMLSPSTIYGFNGTFPGPMINFEYGRPAIVRFENDLDQNPLCLDRQDFGAPDWAFLTHLHNGHTAPESDGQPHHMQENEGGYRPGQWCDNLYLGYAAGGFEEEKQSFLWFHDHRMHHTGPNVYKGMVGLMPHYDPPTANNPLGIDSGDETTGLKIPGVRVNNPDGTFDVKYDIPLALYDVRLEDAVTPHQDEHQPLAVCGKTHPEWWGKQFLQHYPNHGFIGDIFTVNCTAYPVYTVDRRTYRFRFLGASISRQYELSFRQGNLVPAPGRQGQWSFGVVKSKSVSFNLGTQCMRMVQIAAEGGLLPKPMLRDSIEIWPAKRREVIVDFSKYMDGTPTKKGDVIYLTNTCEMLDGRQITKRGSFAVPMVKFIVGNLPVVPDASDPGLSANTFNPNKSLRARFTPPVPFGNKDVPKDMDFVLQRGGSAGAETEWLINGLQFDPLAPLWAPNVNTFETWGINNGGGGWTHPMHIHMEEHQVVYRTDSGIAHPEDGPVPLGKEDVVALEPSEQTIIYRGFRTFLGNYVAHCHNLAHEDHNMMFGWSITK